MGSTTFTSMAGLARRFFTVCGDLMSAKTRCSSSQTAVVPFGERFGVPSGHTGFHEAESLSWITRFMSPVRITVSRSLRAMVTPPEVVGLAAENVLAPDALGEAAAESFAGITRSPGPQR